MIHIHCIVGQFFLLLSLIGDAVMNSYLPTYDIVSGRTIFHRESLANINKQFDFLLLERVVLLLQRESMDSVLYFILQSTIRERESCVLYYYISIF